MPGNALRIPILVIAAVALVGVSPIPVNATSVVQRVEKPPLRDLPRDATHELRVLYLEDPRLPTLDEAQVSALCRKLEVLAEEWFGYNVRLRQVGRRNLDEYFAAHETAFERERKIIQQVDLDPSNPADRTKILQTIYRDFRPRPLPLLAQYLRVDEIKSPVDAAKIGFRQFFERLKELRGIPVPDGRPFFDPVRARLYSYVHWCVLQRAVDDVEFFLTNSMILGADSEMPIYVIVRGGLTNGSTVNHPRNPFETSTMVGLFPFLSDSAVFLRERGRIPEDERLDAIATMCMHELGHFLMRTREYYDHAGCVHVAPPGLNYYEWHRDVRSTGPCRLAHARVRRF